MFNTTLEKDYDCKFLKWDSDYFGISSARVNLYGVLSMQSQEKVLEFCKDYKFVTICNFNNITENNYWIGNITDAFQSDINIQFIKTISDDIEYKNRGVYVTNSLYKNEQILDIAKNSFNYSRFFNDPRLPRRQAKNIYVYWTECAFKQNDKYFVIYEKDGIILGYILFSINESDSVIELIAVDNKFQGQKIGKLLIEAMESFVLEKGIKKIKVGTQVNNIMAVQFYNHMGFKYVSCSSIYHLWNDNWRD